MFQFRRFPTYTYLFSIRYVDIVHVGCPIRKSPDIAPVYGSPRLIAVSHVLLRLPVPRHSPCALSSLTFMWSSFVLNKKWIVVLINYPIFKTYMDFQDGLHICPISRLSFLCSVFKVRSRVKPEFQHLNFKCWNSASTSNKENWWAKVDSVFSGLYSASLREIVSFIPRHFVNF